jgi:sn-glycerol 3-phosphate transport system substrate-binding protein
VARHLGTPAAALAARPGRRLAAAATALLTVTLAACGGGGGQTSGSGAAPGEDALTKAGGVVQIEFWHSMKGANAAAIDKLVSAFNAEHQGKIQVTASFQGDYDATIAKYKAAVQQKNTPDLIQIYDIGSRFMIDSKQTLPMHKFIESDKWDASVIEPNIANYYSIDGKLQSMPFNSSMPLLYLNREAFAKAGLDPDKPPRNLDEIADYAQKLTVKDASGHVTQYGFGAAIYGWFVEQLLAQDGKQYCDQDNGRKGLATAVQFDSDTGVHIAQWWSDLVKAGYATNTGRKTDDAQAAFKSGTVAMHLESTGALRGYLDAAKGKFTVTTAPFPKVSASSSGGPIIGGASLWIDDVGHNDAEKRASWEFVKFAVSSQQQAQWHAGTGYFPVNRKALDEDVDKQWVAQYPQFNTAIEQLHSTQPSVASAGCILGVMPQARQAAESGLEKAITGGAAPEQAMKDAAASVKPEIANYNSAVG